MESLADKSLIRIEPPSEEPAAIEDEVRFGLHPLLREYALERLAESAESTLVEARHADALTALAEALGPEIIGQRAGAVLRRLDREAPNLRAALDWSMDNDAPDVGLRLAGSVWRWYHQRNHLREGRAILAELLAKEPHGDPRARIAGLAAAGGLAYWMSDVAAAEDLYGERLALAASVGDPGLLGDAHYDIGFTAMMRMDGESLRRHETEALRLYEAAGDGAGAIRARQALVLGVFLSGDFGRARELEEQNLAAFRATTSRNEIADSLTFLTAVHMQLGQPDVAWSRFTEALGMFAETNHGSGLARSLGMAAILLAKFGDAELAARLAGAAYELVRVHGVMMAPVMVLHLPDPRDLAVELLGADRAEELIAAGAATPLAEVIDQVLALDAPVGGSGSPAGSRSGSPAASGA